MDSTVYIVIGAQFGDEGKGRTVDDIASNYPVTTVTRYSGGSQASHSVVTPDGIRHAFRHVGSNTFHTLNAFKAGTHLGSNFLVDFTNLSTELTQLSDHGCSPTITIDPDCRVVTIFDIILNQLIEYGRGDMAHGSCGMGIGETVQRNIDGYTLQVGDFNVTDGKSGKYLWNQLKQVGDYFIENLESAMSYDEIACIDYLNANGLSEVLTGLDQFIETEIRNLYNLGTSMVYAIPCQQLTTEPAVHIFEGSQGIRLDMSLWHPTNNPHTTWSSVGLSGALAQLSRQLPDSSSYDTIEVVYVTRCYVTRHGNGPLPYDRGTVPINGHACVNNVPNLFQGEIRYAPLNVNDLADNIIRDCGPLLIAFPKVKVRINVTCLDEADQYPMVIGGSTSMVSRSSLLGTVKAYVGLQFDKLDMSDRFIGVTFTDQEQRIQCTM